jgi:hypothetical protein
MHEANMQQVDIPSGGKREEEGSFVDGMPRGGGGIKPGGGGGKLILVGAVGGGGERVCG